MCVNSIVNSTTRKRRSNKRRGREEKEVKDQLGQCASIFKTVNIDQLHLFFKYIKHKYIVIKIHIYTYTRNLFCTDSIKTLSLTINLKT